jgi:hypothetical protein
MGLFKKIKKGLSSVWKGIKKRFKKALGHVGKFLNSGIGKALMIVVSIFTMGAALAAGYAAWGAAAAEGAGMVGKFVAAGGGFLSSLTGVGAAGKTTTPSLKAGVEVVDKGTQAAGTMAANTQAGAQAIQGTSEMSKMALMDSGLSTVAPTIAPSSAGAISPGVAGTIADAGQSAGLGFAAPSNAEAVTQAISGTAKTGGAGMFSNVDYSALTKQAAQQAAPKLNALQKLSKYGGQIAKGASEFAKTPAGLQTIGQIVGGVGTAMLQKETLEDERRFRREEGRRIRDFGDRFDGSINTSLGSRNYGPREYQSSYLDPNIGGRGRIRMGGG